LQALSSLPACPVIKRKFNVSLPSSFRRVPERWIELGLLTGLALILVPFLFPTFFHGDELTDLNNGLRTFHGEVMYRDITFDLAPLNNLLMAGIFFLLGPSLFAARLVQTGLILLCGWQIYRLSRRLEVPAWAATLPALALVVGLYRARPGVSHHWLAMPFMLAALQAAFIALDSGKWRFWALAGAATAGVMLLMQSDGVVVAFCLAVVALTHGLANRVPSRQLARGFCAGVVGFALPTSLVALYYYAHGALAQAVYEVWISPFLHTHSSGGYNDVGYGSDWLSSVRLIGKFDAFWLGRAYHYSVTYLLAPVAVVGAVLALLPRLRRWSPVDWRLGLMASVAAGYFSLLSVERAIYGVVAIYAVPALPVLAALATRWASHFKDRSRAWLGHGLLAAYVLTGGLLFIRFMQADPGNWLRFTPPDAVIAKEPIFQYLAKHTRHGDRLIAMPIGGVFYFFGRPPATRYPIILPLSQRFTTAADLAEVRGEIARNHPSFLILGPYGVASDDIVPYLNGPLPPGYHRVPKVFYFQTGPVYLFARDGAPSERRQATRQKG
jgi:hypothetical protein